MPTRHIEHAYAKLTRTLRITGLRSDGYHLIESEMVTLSLSDELVIEDGDGLVVNDEIAWVGSAPKLSSAIPTGPDNLVVRALSITGRTASVSLTKHIPSGAGLGGGSADAAAIFRWAEMSDPLTAARLGSDIPFCLAGGRALVTGVGEIIQALPFEERSFILLTPELSVSTPAVYKMFDAIGATSTHGESPNDLEPAAIAVEPRLTYWRDLLHRVTDKRPTLAGSGSTWFVECDSTDQKDAVLSLREATTGANERACVSQCHTVPATYQREDNRE